jgi:hypothetical protein
MTGNSMGLTGGWGDGEATQNGTASLDSQPMANHPLFSVFLLSSITVSIDMILINNLF